MSASHNPGGPKEDWGIKFNYSSGEPAPERITDAIFKYTQTIKELKTADLPDIDLAKIGNNKFGSFEVGFPPIPLLSSCSAVAQHWCLRSIFARCHRKMLTPEKALGLVWQLPCLPLHGW